jgi:hypothetical protein
MSIAFTCPSCGKAVVVEDHFAGQTGPCAACGKPISIPAPAGAPGTASGSGAVGVLAIVLGIGAAILMLCVGVGGLLYGLVMPEVDKARYASRRVESTNNLRKILMALHAYEAANGAFPPAMVTDPSGKPLYSWRVLILPQLGEDELYAQFDKSKAWDDPANKDVSDAMVDVFRSPSDDDLDENGVSYVAIVGKNTMFPATTGRKVREVQDGASNTIMLLEVRDFPGSWAAPIDPALQQFSGAIVGPEEGQLHPAQPGGAILVGFGDGTVRELKPTAAARVVQPAAITVNDGKITPVE